MYLWQMSLVTLAVMTALGVALRFLAMATVNGVLSDWRTDGERNLIVLWHEHWPLALCIALEGVIANISLLVLIISVPVFFIWGK